MSGRIAANLGGGMESGHWEGLTPCLLCLCLYNLGVNLVYFTDFSALFC